MADLPPVQIEVCYARDDVQVIVALSVEQGITVREAIRRSGLLQRFPEIDLEREGAGISGKRVDLSDVPKPGDRIEIYRPLTADPKLVRRRLAREGRTMGSKKPES